jgi:hypothetical protein
VTYDCSSKDCSKALDPTADFPIGTIYLYRNSAYRFEPLNFISDPNEGVDIDLSLSISLGQTSLFMSVNEDNIIEQKSLNEDEYEFHKSTSSTTTVQITVEN